MSHRQAAKNIPERTKSYFASSGIALTLVDAMAEDMPIVDCNQAFCDLTGYDKADVIGRNCRFLQPNEGAGPVGKRIRTFLNTPSEHSERFLIPNERRNGVHFVNMLYLAHVPFQDGRHFILGSQFDATKVSLKEQHLYDLALAKDVKEIATRTSEEGLITLGTFTALANSAAIIVKNSEVTS